MTLAHFFSRGFWLFILCVLFFTSQSLAQVRIVQWSDAHSTLKTLPYQLEAIDRAAADFYSLYPKGEFVVFVNGDHTSLNPWSQADTGFMSLEALKVLKDRGYTVLFNVGNHDAFDWTGPIDGIELFLKQMKQLRDWDIVVLGANFKKPKEPFASLIIPFYTLRTLKRATAFVGMTIEVLIEKSNVNKNGIKKLFKKVQTYEESLRELAPLLREQKVQQIVLGVHEGHVRLSELVEKMQQSSKHYPAIPLLMGGDDHLVTAYRRHDSLISDGGSHGSFNIIDLDVDGALQFPIRHISISEEALLHIKKAEFTHGVAVANPHADSGAPELIEFSQKVKGFVAQLESNLNRVLVHTSGVSEHKRHLKKGRTELGHLLSESLVSWVKDLRVYSQGEPVLAMFNSSSYRFEHVIPEGPITEMTFRSMYSYLNEAAVFRLTGKEIELLFRSLQKYYGVDKGLRYTPQMNRNLKSEKGRLLILQNNEWIKIEKNTSYLVVFDGWLSSPRNGQGPQIKEWLHLLRVHRPLATKMLQDLLVEYLPQQIANSPTFAPKKTPVACGNFF